MAFENIIELDIWTEKMIKDAENKLELNKLDIGLSLLKNGIALINQERFNIFYEIMEKEKEKGVK